MATDVLLVREGNALKAADPISAETLSAMKHGEVVTATLKRTRNIQHHRKAFALLSLVQENQDQYPDVESLLTAVKVGIGHCTWINATIRGIHIQIPIPKSISFASMSQDKFEKFYEKMVVYILSDILPGVNKDDLERQVLEML